MVPLYLLPPKDFLHVLASAPGSCWSKQHQLSLIMQVTSGMYTTAYRGRKHCLDGEKAGVTLHCNSSIHKQFMNAVYSAHRPSHTLGSCPAVFKAVNS